MVGRRSSRVPARGHRQSIGSTLHRPCHGHGLTSDRCRRRTPAPKRRSYPRDAWGSRRRGPPRSQPQTLAGLSAAVVPEVVTGLGVPAGVEPGVAAVTAPVVGAVVAPAFPEIWLTGRSALRFDQIVSAAGSHSTLFGSAGNGRQGTVTKVTSLACRPRRL